MRKILLFALTMLSVQMYSYSLLERFEGNEIKTLDARTKSLGSTFFTTNSVSNYVWNPALMSKMENTIEFGFSNKMFIGEETRSIPMYGSFDSYNGEKDYVVNDNRYYDFEIGAAYRIASFKPFSLYSALTYKPVLDFRSDYYEEVRSNTSEAEIIALNEIMSDGQVAAISWSNAMQINQFSFGFSYHYLMGSQEYERSLKWSDFALDLEDDLVNEMETMERDLSGHRFVLSAGYDLNKRFDFYASFIGKTDFEVENIKTTGRDYKYYYNAVNDTTFSTMKFDEKTLPSEFNFSIIYRPQNIMSTIVNAEFSYIKATDVCDDYEDGYRFAIGVEHYLTDFNPIRFGFSTEKVNSSVFYTNEDNEHWLAYTKQYHIPTISIGTGFEVLDNLTIDLASTISWKSYETIDEFQDGVYDYEAFWNNYIHMNIQDRYWEKPDNVEERHVDIFATLNYKW